MSRKICCAAICISVMMGMFVQASAFDGLRKGFILGGGLGLGSTSVDQSVQFSGIELGSGSESFLGVQTDFKIGYAPSENLAIYYFSDVAWFDMDNALGSSVTIASGVCGLGATYYVNQIAPTFCFGAGVGISTWSLPFESDADTWTGVGVMACFGYEFVRHVSAEIAVTYGEPSTKESGIEATTKATTIRGSINVLAF